MKQPLRLWWAGLLACCAGAAALCQTPQAEAFFSYGGVCVRPDGRHLDHAALHCVECGMTTRLRAGRFSFPRLSANTSWTIACTRPVITLADLSVADERLLEAWLAGRDTLSFFQRLAADLDRNGRLDSTDLALLRRLVRTGQPDTLVRWHFVADTAARHPRRGWPALDADTFRVQGRAGQRLFQRLVALKMGDLAWPQPAPERPAFDPAFSLGRVQVCTTAEVVRVPLEVRDARQVVAFQFGVHWDTTLLSWRGFEPAAGCAHQRVAFAERQNGLAVVWSKPFDCRDTLPRLMGWLVWQLRRPAEGVAARIRFSDEVLPVEVLDAKGHRLNSIFSSGKVEVVAAGSRTAIHALELRAPSCAGGSDGRIRLMASGTAVRSWRWNTGATGPELSHLPAGTYTVTITDSAGCPFTYGPLQLADPPPLEWDAHVEPPSCSAPASGSIELRVRGGVPPYSLQWHDGLVGLWRRDSLRPGRYAWVLTDSAGCRHEHALVLPDPVHWQLVAAAHLPRGASGPAAFRFYHLAAGGERLHFRWSDGVREAARADLPFGKWHLEIRTPSGCRRRLVLELSERFDGRMVPHFTLEKAGQHERLLTDAVLVLMQPVQARLTILGVEGQVLHAAGLSLPAGTTVLCMAWPEAWKAALDLPSGVRYEWKFR